MSVSGPPPAEAGGRLRRLTERYRRYVEPSASGLPNRRVMLIPPAVLLIVAIAAIALGLNGFSSGAFHSSVSTARDPQLIAGEPRDIRTDEWYVQTVWAIAQVQQGLPAENKTFPGGMDATIPQDLPRLDWTVAFRPHLLGFLVLDAGRAVAVKWWALVVGLLVAAYWFVVTLFPRRPLAAVAFALAFYFSPLFQWWFLATTLWPAAWALFVMTAIMWASRCRSGIRWLWGAGAGYLTVVMAMGIYVPYIVPVALVAVAFAIGWTVQSVRRGSRLRHQILAYVPLAVGQVGGVAIVLVWLATRTSVVTAFLSTAYPGQRVSPPGEAGALGLAQLLALPFSEGLGAGGLLGANSSEGSTVILTGAFLLPVVLWFVILLVRRRARVPWALVAVAIATLVLIAYIAIPGWEPLAHLLLLDRGTANRMRIGIGLGSFVILVLFLREAEERAWRAGRAFSIVLSALVALSAVAIAVAIARVVPKELLHIHWWWLLVILVAGGVLVAARRLIGLTALLTLVLALSVGVWVNPVYQGVLDLRSTPVAKRVIALDRSHGGVWVGVGGRLTTAVLLESGVEAYNGFQGAPSRRMWAQIDPRDQYEFQWNRLAGVSWTPGRGRPVVTNPAPDQILVSFDACSAFARSHVSYVLGDRAALRSDRCLRPVESFTEPHSTLTVYRVVRG